MKTLRGAELAAAVVVALSATGCISNDSGVGDSRFPMTRRLIEEHLETSSTPSVSVAVARDGEIIWQESFGLADVERGIEATPHTAYHLGSLGKVYTATAIMVLKERGLIDLDRPANDYLGEAKIRAFEGDAADATLRRILNHTSGLPFFWTHLYEEELEARPPWDEVIGNHAALVSPPGERFIYSNLGFGLLGHIVERVTGRPYAELMKAEILEPLRLESTMIDTGPSFEIPVAQKYSPEGKVPYSDHICKGGGTVWASAHDLVHFGMFHLKNHLPDQEVILSDSAIDEMQGRDDLSPPRSVYRIGWQLSNRFGYPAVQHGGHVFGTNSALKLVPSENIAVAVVSNGEESDPYGIIDSILAELLLRYRFLAAAERVFARDVLPFRTRSSSPGTLAGEWEGTIVTRREKIPIRLSIPEEGDIRLGYPGSGRAGLPPLEKFPVRLSNGEVMAIFPLEISTPFTDRYPHWTVFNLALRGDVLSGYASAEASESQRPHFNVPFYVRLTRAGV